MACTDCSKALYLVTLTIKLGTQAGGGSEYAYGPFCGLFVAQQILGLFARGLQVRFPDAGTTAKEEFLNGGSLVSGSRRAADMNAF